MEKIKFKPLSKEKIIISIDRLTRFRDTESKYLRVYKDILINNLIEPKFKKSEIDETDYAVLTEIAEYILNNSIKIFVPDAEDDLQINERLLEYEKGVFVFDKNTEKLLNNKINYKAALKLIPRNAPLNLKWLAVLADSKNPGAESFVHALHFPVKKLVICEGITEETLLPVFAHQLNYNFDKHGIHVISAGGKNQVVKTFYKFAENLKIPIFVLLDSDARENYEEILPRLRKTDKVYILPEGEFEDILPVKLIEKALKYSIANISSSPVGDVDNSCGMVHYLEDFFKHRGIHEFKKSEFAQAVKLNVSAPEDVSEEFRRIIDELSSM